MGGGENVGSVAEIAPGCCLFLPKSGVLRRSFAEVKPEHTDSSARRGTVLPFRSANLQGSVGAPPLLMLRLNTVNTASSQREALHNPYTGCYETL